MEEANNKSVEEIWRSLKETKLVPPKLPAGTNWNALSSRDEPKKFVKSGDSSPLCPYSGVTPLGSGFETAYLKQENQRCSDDATSSPVAEFLREVREAGDAVEGKRRNRPACDAATDFARSPVASLARSEKDLEEAQRKEALFRVVYELGDEVTDVRYGALMELRHILFSENTDEGQVLRSSTDSAGCSIVQDTIQEQQYVPGLAKNELAWVVEELVITALLRRFGDEAEKCRHLSIAILQDLLQIVPNSVLALLPYILPVICELLPLKEFVKAESRPAAPEVELRGVNVEMCEELRLSLVQLIHKMLKQAPPLFRPFASEVSSILMAAASDSHPEILKETFAAFDLFGNHMGDMLKPVAKQLVASIIPSLAHTHHQVRVAALRAICRLVHCGAHESIYDLTAFRDPNLIPIRSFYHPDTKTQYLALLAADRSAAVREELLKTVSSWLLDLEQRKEHEVRLLPYILSGFTDQNFRLRELAFSMMEGIGRRYEQDFENEVRDVKDYLPEATADIVSIAGNPLPPPFTRRPCLGARILVKSCFSVMLHAISADLLAWTSGTKVLAADFLMTMLIFIEDNVIQHLQPVLSILGKTCRDQSIGKKIRESAHIVGYFASPPSYLALILPQVTGEFEGDSALYHVAQALTLLSSMMRGTPEPALRPHIPEICTILTERDLITSIQQEVIEGVISVTKELVAAWDEECKGETISVMWILLNAAAAMDFCGRAATEIQGILLELAIASGYDSAEDHISASTETMLSLLPPPDLWANRSLEVNIFCLLLQQTNATTPSTLVQYAYPFYVYPRCCFAKMADVNMILRSLSDLRLFNVLEATSKDNVDMDVRLRLIFAVQSMVVCTPDNFPCTEAAGAQLVEGFIIPCLKLGGVFLRPTIGILQGLLSRPWFQLTTSLTAITTSMLQEIQKEVPEDDDDGEYGSFREPGTEYLIKSVLDQISKIQKETDQSTASDNSPDPSTQALAVAE